MSLFTIFKCILIALIIGFSSCLFIYCFDRIMKYFLDKDYIFLAWFFAVVLIAVFSIFYFFSLDVFLDYMSRVLP